MDSSRIINVVCAKKLLPITSTSIRLNILEKLSAGDTKTKKITLVAAGGTVMTLLDLKPSTIDIDFTISGYDRVEFE